MSINKISLIARTETQRCTETVSFRCRPEYVSMLEKLQEYYNTDRTDILLQLIRLAYKSIRPK